MPLDKPPLQGVSNNANMICFCQLFRRDVLVRFLGPRYAGSDLMSLGAWVNEVGRKLGC